jgi:foldase protein PrsA
VQEAGGFKVSQLEWDAELLSIPERARERYNNEKGKADISERILLNKALFEEARKAGILDDEKVRMSARMAAEKAYVNALLAKVEADSASEEAVKKHFDENQAKYARPMARVRHILVKDEKLAKDLKAKIDGGADFAALAKEHSEDRGSKQNGGELPWATRDRWVPEFADVAFAQEANQVSEPVKSKFGFHIIQTLEKREVQPLEEVRPGIERVLTRNAVRDYKEKIKEQLGLGRSAQRPPVPGQPGEGGETVEIKLPEGHPGTLPMSGTPGAKEGETASKDEAAKPPADKAGDE